MILQSKRNPDKTIEVSVEDWEKMKKNDLHRKFRIISSKDLAPGIEVKPQDVVNFMDEPKKIYDDIAEDGIIDYNTLLKAELIVLCEQEGIELTGKELKSDLVDLLNNK